MELPALFSLISAAILGLLPVLLLFGRRRMQRRTRSTDRTAGASPSAGGQAPSGAAVRAMGREDAQTGERPILDRLTRENLRTQRESERVVPEGRAWWGGDADTRERELRDAAIIAGVPTPAPGPAPAVRSGGERPQTRRPQARPKAAASVSATAIGSRTRGPTGRADARTIEQRLAHLTPLQRAIAYGEILGRPAALRRPGRHDEL